MGENRNKPYTDNEKEQVLNLYNEGITRPSKICCVLKHKVSADLITEILKDKKKDDYLKEQIDGVSKEHILYLYENLERNVLEILYFYPNLTFGQVKDTIEGYYNMLSIKKPRGISFPRKAIQLSLKTKSIEEVSEEYGYSVDTIYKKFAEIVEKKKISKEDLLDLQMILVNRGLEEYHNQDISRNEFRMKYYNLNPDKVEGAVKEYMKRRKKEFK